MSWQSCVFSRKAVWLRALGRKIVNNYNFWIPLEKQVFICTMGKHLFRCRSCSSHTSLSFFARPLPGYAPPIPRRNRDTDHSVCWTDAGVDNGVLAHPCYLVRLQNMFKMSLLQSLFLNDKAMKNHHNVTFAGVCNLFSYFWTTWFIDQGISVNSSGPRIFAFTKKLQLLAFWTLHLAIFAIKFHLANRAQQREIWSESILDQNKGCPQTDTKVRHTRYSGSH